MIHVSQSEGIKPPTASGASDLSWWLSFGNVRCFWAWQLPCRYMQVMLQQNAGHVSLSSLTEAVWVEAWVLCVVPLTDMKLDCRPDFVTLVWTESRPQADTSLFRLGNCFPTSVSDREAVFSVDVNDCNFRRLVSSVLLPANCESAVFSTAWWHLPLS